MSSNRGGQRSRDGVAGVSGQQPDGAGTLQPQPVTIIDAGLRKNLDLGVISPVDDFGPLPERSV